jgi:hypothetical protein
MPQMLIIFGAKSGIIRRYVIADSEADKLDPAQHVMPGEDYIESTHDAFNMARGNYPDPDISHRMVALKLGCRREDIPDPRCAVIGPHNRVVKLLCADPDIDKHPDGELVLSMKASIGDFWTGTDFLPSNE